MIREPSELVIFELGIYFQYFDASELNGSVRNSFWNSLFYVEFSIGHYTSPINYPIKPEPEPNYPSLVGPTRPAQHSPNSDYNKNGYLRGIFSSLKIEILSLKVFSEEINVLARLSQKARQGKFNDGKIISSQIGFCDDHNLSRCYKLATIIFLAKGHSFLLPNKFKD